MLDRGWTCGRVPNPSWQYPSLLTLLGIPLAIRDARNSLYPWIAERAKLTETLGLMAVKAGTPVVLLTAGNPYLTFVCHYPIRTICAFDGTPLVSTRNSM